MTIQLCGAGGGVMRFFVSETHGTEVIINFSLSTRSWLFSNPHRVWEHTVPSES
jgi:hypothetical protein